MEGYLLAFQKERDVQVWFCALEDGALRCYNKPHGELLELVQLTRHRVRVTSGLEGVCPNRFAVGTVEVARNDETGRLMVVGERENAFYFAAPTVDKMRKWSRAIQNWRRHSFDDPALALASKLEISGDAMAARKRAMREEVESLLYFASAFDLRLKKAAPRQLDSGARGSRRFFRISLVVAKHEIHDTSDRRSLPSRQLSRLSTWIPVPPWRRVGSKA